MPPEPLAPLAALRKSLVGIDQTDLASSDDRRERRLADQYVFVVEMGGGPNHIVDKQDYHLDWGYHIACKIVPTLSLDFRRVGQRVIYQNYCPDLAE